MKKLVYFPDETCPGCGDDLCVVTSHVEDAEKGQYWDGDSVVCSTDRCPAAMWISVNEDRTFFMNYEGV